MDKQIALKSISEMPMNFELDELFERLLVLDKIEKGRKDVEAGRIYTHEDAKKKFHKWLK